MSDFDHPLDRFLVSGGVLQVVSDGQMLSAPPSGAKLLLPGSFNPVHQGHWELARVAEQMLGFPAAFELSVVNVDKPTLSRAEICQRLHQFEGQASVWLTHAPRFVEKAERFPGATFLVGADTAMRIVTPRYYQNDVTGMVKALRRIAELNCRFLVACRLDDRGKCWSVCDVPIPPDFCDLFDELAQERFRRDISSTELRARLA